MSIWSDVHNEYSGRILPVTEEIADLSGRLIVRELKAGFMPQGTDTLIAATALVHGMRLATMNVPHFERFGVELVNF